MKSLITINIYRKAPIRRRRLGEIDPDEARAILEKELRKASKHYKPYTPKLAVDSKYLKVEDGIGKEAISGIKKLKSEISSFGKHKELKYTFMESDSNIGIAVLEKDDKFSNLFRNPTGPVVHVFSFKDKKPEVSLKSFIWEQLVLATKKVNKLGTQSNINYTA